MTGEVMERALFLADADRLQDIDEPCDRIYFGRECCARLLPGRKEMERAREAAAGRGLAFTLVTPLLDDRGVKKALSLAGDLEGDDGAEIVVNDFGLLERLSEGGWKGTAVVGRLLTRQRRGAGWRGTLPPEEEAASYLRKSALESEAMVDLLRGRYGIRRFEIDDLPQGVEVGPLPEDVRLSLYTPWVLVTLTRLCPWSFDGKRWKDGGGCSFACRGEHLLLEPEGGGPPLLMGGCGQFLKKKEGPDISRGIPVDRIVYQPRIPA